MSQKIYSPIKAILPSGSFAPFAALFAAIAFSCNSLKIGQEWPYPGDKKPKTMLFLNQDITSSPPGTNPILHMNEIGKDIYSIPGKGNANPGGWNSKHPLFADILRWYDSPTIIEVGTWLGASAIHMGNIIKTGKIYCVDTWLGSLEFWTTHRQTPERDLMLKHGYPQVYYQFIRNVQAARLEHLITPVPMPSVQAAQYFKHMEITADVIYIDASHEQDDVKRDILAYLPLLKPGGVIFGDDYTSFAGVAIAVKEVFGVSFEVLDNNFWMYRK